MPDKLDQAVTAIKAGKRKAAYQLLVEVIKTDPKSKEAEKAWILMSIVVEDPIRKQQSLDAALALNPNNNEAKQRLENLMQSKQNAPGNRDTQHLRSNL